ncbi:hypothetical protein Q9S36_17050 [Microbacterium sp. ARD31]|uniref:uridine kinase family protein n=1 Tax=Microbacterium sp. ARD31 TaxID=2962576 RepID=UPI0028822962|nr:hypothetical protein [Microbacterium sp. ARD31]MDT0181888.1 hypothetical protein [Microbacterium sp. ARD31]
MQLQPEEPHAGPWTVRTHAELAAHLIGRAAVSGRPAIVAVDGRSGAGKSTLADALARATGSAQVVHTDDFAWHEPFFGWGRVLRPALAELRSTGALEFTPPAWVARGRDGSVRVPPGRRLVIVEGVGSSQREVADLIDAVVWVQSDDVLTEQRGIARDLADGVNGDEAETVAFWHEWIGAERPFLAEDRPWERADVIVAGTPVMPTAVDEVACAPGALVGG